MSIYGMGGAPPPRGDLFLLFLQHCCNKSAAPFRRCALLSFAYYRCFGFAAGDMVSPPQAIL